ncbi:MAG: 6-phosphogluconolactonase [bacterium]|nr:6-phosphogluconolactonase [bacterium]MDE0287754.1 6-phosphogluconolactonase [bacterium]MDE0437451.1 6-phosphogluconolactonase [bacterium]
MGNRLESCPADVEVFADADELAIGASDRIAGFIRQHATNHPGSRRVTVAMAGGSTPVAAYRRLAGMDVPWERVCAWVGDERYVPPDHPDSNGSMIGRELLDGTGARFLRIPWKEGRSPTRAAALYEERLLDEMAHDSGGPRPDLVLVGMGGDGHTLSLFPGSAAIDVTDRWYVAGKVEAAPSWRLTATYPLVHRARRIYALVSGGSKAEALSEVLYPTGHTALPARLLMAGDAPVTWLVDEAAASLLSDA